MVGSTLFIKSQISLLKKSPHLPALSPSYSQSLVQSSKKSLTEEKIKLILKTDTLGSLEAITAGLRGNIEVLLSGVGQITESDVLLAKTTQAFIIGFHQDLPANVGKLAIAEKVIVKTYNVIYELFDELDEVLEAFKKGNLVTALGEAKIIAIFDIKDEKIAGVKVISGRIARGDNVKIMRGDQEIDRARIKSLRHLKEDINKAEQGTEAGVLLSKKLDILTGDSIISIG